MLSFFPVFNAKLLVDGYPVKPNKELRVIDFSSYGFSLTLIQCNTMILFIAYFVPLSRISRLLRQMSTFRTQFKTLSLLYFILLELEGIQS